PAGGRERPRRRCCIFSGEFLDVSPEATAILVRPCFHRPFPFPFASSTPKSSPGPRPPSVAEEGDQHHAPELTGMRVGGGFVARDSIHQVDAAIVIISSSLEIVVGKAWTRMCCG